MKVLITIPVYNEEKNLEKNILFLDNYLQNNFKYNYIIEIVDNNSNDGTKKIGQKLSKLNKRIKYLFLKKQGKGYAIKTSWNRGRGKYNVFSFMDIDISTDLYYYNNLIDAIVKEKYDISIGSRYEKESVVYRSFKRNFFAKCYNLFQKILFNINFNDSQCGFKAIKPDIYFKISQYFLNKKFSFDKTDMFFDTELLILASKLNYKIKSIPIVWKSNEYSKVKVFKISIIFLFYLFYLKYSLLRKNFKKY